MFRVCVRRQDHARIQTAATGVCVPVASTWTLQALSAWRTAPPALITAAARMDINYIFTIMNVLISMSVRKNIIRVAMRDVSIPLEAMSVSARRHSTLIIPREDVFLTEVAGVVMDLGRTEFGGQNSPTGLEVIILRGILSIQVSMEVVLDILRAMDDLAAVTMVLLDRDSMVNLDIQVKRALEVILEGRVNLEAMGHQLEVPERLFVQMEIFTQATRKEVMVQVMGVQVILAKMVGQVTMVGPDIQVNLDDQATTVDLDRQMDMMEGAVRLTAPGVDMMYLAQMADLEAPGLVDIREHQDVQVMAQEDFRQVKIPGLDIQAKMKGLATHRVVKMGDLGTQDIQDSQDIQEEDIQTTRVAAKFQVTMTIPDQEDIQAQYRAGRLACLVLETETRLVEEAYQVLWMADKIVWMPPARLAASC
jgi:hypothetical protein